MDDQARLVNTLYEQAKAVADTQRSAFPDYWNWYIGNHWPKKRPSYRASHVTNFVFSNIETIKPILTDHRPNFVVLPRGGTPDDGMKAKLANMILRYLWDVTGLDIKLPEALTSSLVYGTSFLMPCWDAEVNNALGEMDVIVPHPTLVDPDPACTSLADARFFFVTSFVPKSMLVAAYGDVAKKVTPDANVKDMPHERESAGLQVISSSTQPNVGAVGQNMDTVDYLRTNFADSNGGELCKLIRGWFRDDTIDTVEQPPAPPARIRRYPTGRMLHVANGVVLRDVPNPYVGPPLVRIVDHNMPARFWGMGEVQQVIEIQKEINKRKSQIIDIASLTANPQWLIDSRISPEMKDRLTNEPGLQIEVENPEGWELSRLIKWNQPPTMPMYVIATLGDSKKDMQIISGVQDVTRGQAPSGIEAGKAIIALQTETKRRIGLKLRNMEYALAELGALLLSGVQTFWEEGRQFRLTEGQFRVPPDFFKDFEYDVRVQAGSSLPVDKGMAVQEALAMLQAGVIDEEAVLEIKDPPNKQEILDRMKPMWDMKKLMMQAGPPPTEPGGPGGQKGAIPKRGNG